MNLRSRTRSSALGAVLVVALGGAVLAAPGPTMLPTGWQIRGPEGAVATVGTLPQGIVISRDGAQIVELEGGYRKPALRVLDARTLASVRSVELGGAYGVPLRDPAGEGVWVNVAGTFQEQIAHVDTASGTVDRAVTLPQPFFPVALARSHNGSVLAVAGDLANRVAFVDASSSSFIGTQRVGSHPAALAFSADDRTLYVAERGTRYVDVMHERWVTVRKPGPWFFPPGELDDWPFERIRVGSHPVALALRGSRLYVANSDDDDVAVVDTGKQRVVARAQMPFARPGAVGASPNALALDGDRLYVSCGAANAVAVFRLQGDTLTPLGAIPTGWYPTAVAVDRAHGVLYVADGKGESSHANPKYAVQPNSTRPANPAPAQYVGDQLVGSIRRIAIPDDAALARGLADVRALAQHEGVPPSEIVRAGGPIKHVIYVIKENRSYDQVLGDVAGADGDPQLVLFGAAVTPNQHALAQRFGVFDRFFENAHVSADGHNWATAAFANDYLEKMWPATYGDRRGIYDFEDGAEASVPHAGYLWDNAAAHHVTLRNYGEFVSAGPSKPTPVSTTSEVLRTHTDRNFPPFDMDVRDVDRFTEWKREFDAYEASRTLPQLEIMRLPRDHTSGTRAGSPTPQAMVADNDLALGKLVEAVSHSPDWASTAIFVVEDDAQNGPDHVDEQRAPFYLISPYAAGGVQHMAYTQASVLRTIEILLGLPPLSAYDAGARPLTAAFRTTPNLQPFDVLPPRTELDATNPKTAYRAGDSARMDLAHADRVDAGEMNDILWHAVKGARATPPPHGAFAR